MTKFISNNNQVVLLATGNLEEISQDAMTYNSMLLKDIFKKSRDIDLARAFALQVIQDMRDTLESMENDDFDIDEDTEFNLCNSFEEFLSALNQIMSSDDNDDEDLEDN